MAKVKPTAAKDKELPPVVAVAGGEPFLQRQAVDAILQAAGADAQRADVDGATAEPAEVFDELRSMAMFGGRRVVVVRDAEQFVQRHRQTLEVFLADPAAGGNVLVLRCASLPKNQKVYKLIDKVGRVENVEPPKANALPRWLQERAKQAHGITLDPAAANLLADLIGGDLGSLDNELGKLALQVGDDGRATADMIAGGVAFRREQEMYRLTDALTRGDAGGALTIWRQLLSTDDAAEFKAVTWLAIWLERAGEALRLSQKGRRPFDIAKELRVWPADNVRPLLESAERLGEHGLREATDRLAELDYRAKTGLGDARRSAERFIAAAAGVAA